LRGKSAKNIRQNHDGVRSCTHVKLISEQLLKRKADASAVSGEPSANFHVPAQSKLPALRTPIVLQEIASTD